ncbi:hypothetical protein BABINDRAFT_161434 [Babjeviella inositovora NRRL Y-12698]|uniref:Uncharacterized protein n=1 Tax=Babjeviella inositovora NRRL Y-12698 TaxID=984486 RepID=A0A1E3QPU3_9ASCO|nr:uncharacterized protein BABINDRAFT_161434 [Babjeviella inositovora NRRL Y-12698]ODQ79726.1 hypothetical protein BABINDRAFT_161434 [Babjeviella inositovora NRRL Y-12698]
MSFLGHLDASTKRYQYIHHIKYNYERLKIHYVHNKYSTSRNPRVVQGRIPNERLISLRTYPHDEYLLKPGEYFDFASAYVNKGNQAAQLPITLSHVCSEGDLLENEGYEPLIRVNSAPPTILVHSPEDPAKRMATIVPNGSSCKCSCHLHEHLPEPETMEELLTMHGNLGESKSGAGGDSPLSYIEDENIYLPRKKHRFWGLGRKRMSNGANVPSPILECNSASPGLREDKPRLSHSEGKLSPVVIKNSYGHPRPRHSEVKSEKTPIMSRLSSMKRLGSLETRISRLSTEAESHLTEGCQCYRCERLRLGSGEAVWKRVMNDVSLSAARISIGAKPKPLNAYINLSADFTSAKCSPVTNTKTSSPLTPIDDISYYVPPVLSEVSGSCCTQSINDLSHREINNVQRERPSTSHTEVLPAEYPNQASPYSALFSGYYSEAETPWKSRRSTMVPPRSQANSESRSIRERQRLGDENGNLTNTVAYFDQQHPGGEMLQSLNIGGIKRLVDSSGRSMFGSDKSLSRGGVYVD